MNSKLKYIVAVILVVLVGFLIYKANKKSLTDAQKIELAYNNLLAKSPSVVELMKSIQVPANQIISENLKGVDLGQTTIYGDGSFTVKVDCNYVFRCMDRLEPVIAHELFHVYQGKIKQTPAEFIERVNLEKSKFDWYHRPVELEAIAWENKIRVELRHNDPKGFSTMPETREITNKRFALLKRY
jgi:hypothetical protein